MARRRGRTTVAALVAGVLTVGALGACATSESTGTAAAPSTAATTATPSTTAAPTAAPTTGMSTTAPTPTPPSSAASPSAPAGPVAVTRATLDLVDPSRPTPAGAATDALATRALETWVWYPSAASDGGPPDGQRFPLIVFAHGLSGHPEKFTGLLSTWAAAGYVVAAPAFPLTNVRVPSSWENFADVADQPGDVRFVTDELLARAGDDADPIGTRIDPERLGVGGLSLGGATTYLAALNEASRDPRVDAAMVLSGVAGNDPETGTFLEPSGVPALLMHGDADLAAPLAVAEEAFALLAPPKYLVVLHGGDHAPPFEDDPSPFDELTASYTTTFWDAWLRGDDAAKERLVTDLDGVREVTLTFE